MKHLIAAALIALSAPLCAAPLGDDGLHDVPWIHETFLDLREDLAEAEAAGKRLMLIVEQRGCIYCTRMHEDVFPDPQITDLLENDFFVIRLNMFGDLEVTDFDGTVLSEKQIMRRWGVLFTPTMLFFPPSPDDVPEDATAAQAAVAIMPGAFETPTTFDLLTWVLEEGYTGEEPFQKYHARKMAERAE